ncbi:MAG: hypothetical protein KF780_07930 [Sphingomonas sp.]|nr:hypothetical protein [Sphingomonas sp.]
MRLTLLAIPLFLAGCGGAVPAGQADSADAGDGRIECRPEGAAEFAPVCLLERAGETLTLRKPDGGFRRLIVTTDGRGVVAADGAEPARVRVIGEGRIEVTIGGDAFRLPATVRAP